MWVVFLDEMNSLAEIDDGKIPEVVLTPFNHAGRNESARRAKEEELRHLGFLQFLTVIRDHLMDVRRFAFDGDFARPLS